MNYYWLLIVLEINLFNKMKNIRYVTENINIFKIKFKIRLEKLSSNKLIKPYDIKLHARGIIIQSIKFGFILEYLINWKRLILKFKTSLKNMERTYPLIPKTGSKK